MNIQEIITELWGNVKSLQSLLWTKIDAAKNSLSFCFCRHSGALLSELKECQRCVRTLDIQFNDAEGRLELFGHVVCQIRGVTYAFRATRAK